MKTPREWWISGWDKDAYAVPDYGAITVFVTNDNPGKPEAFKVREVLPSETLTDKEFGMKQMCNNYLTGYEDGLVKVPQSQEDRDLTRRIIEAEAKLKIALDVLEKIEQMIYAVKAGKRD